MKRTNLLIKGLLCLASVCCLSACGDDSNIDFGGSGNNGGNNTDGDEGGSGVTELAMTLASSPSGSIVLDRDNPDQKVIDFTWTAPVKDLSSEYALSYVTLLDVQGNDYGTVTAIRTEEAPGTMSRSYTSAELQNWADERWGVTEGENFTLQFKVIAQWKGGSQAVTPEEKYLNISVTPMEAPEPPVEPFTADRILLAGDAVGEESVEFARTMENENLYAALIELKAGELQIPVEIKGETSLQYLKPAGDGSLQDGVAESVTTETNPAGWMIPANGRYRVVVNRGTDQITIYSPENDLKPLIITTDIWANASWGCFPKPWEITEVWLGSNGVYTKAECTTSLADPQVLIYRGDGISATGGMKFVAYTPLNKVEGTGTCDPNATWCYTCPLTADNKRQNLTLELGQVGQLHGGGDTETRNSYYKFSEKPNLVILDLRNMTIVAKSISAE